MTRSRSVPRTTYTPLAVAPSKEEKSASLDSVNEHLKRLAQGLAALEGRFHETRLRNDLALKGLLRLIGIAEPALSESGESKVFFDSGSLKLRASLDGGAFRDFVFASSTRPFSARVTHSVAQAVPNAGVLTALAFDTERWDDGNLHDTVTNNSRINLTTSGATGGDVWLMGANVQWEVPAGANGSYRGLHLRMSGSTIVGSDVRPPVSGVVTRSVTPPVLQLVTLNTEYVEVVVNHDSADATLDIQKSADFSPEFWAFRLPVRELVV